MSRYYVNLCRRKATWAGEEKKQRKWNERESRTDASVATMIRRTTVIDKHVMHVFANTVKSETVRQADRETDRQAERGTGRQRETDRQKGQLTEAQTGRKIDGGRDSSTDLHDFVDACDDNL